MAVDANRTRLRTSEIGTFTRGDNSHCREASGFEDGFQLYFHVFLSGIKNVPFTGCLPDTGFSLLARLGFQIQIPFRKESLITIKHPRLFVVQSDGEYFRCRQLDGDGFSGFIFDRSYISEGPAFGDR